MTLDPQLDHWLAVHEWRYCLMIEGPSLYRYLSSLHEPCLSSGPNTFTKVNYKSPATAAACGELMKGFWHQSLLVPFTRMILTMPTFLVLKTEELTLIALGTIDTVKCQARAPSLRAAWWAILLPSVLDDTRLATQPCTKARSGPSIGSLLRSHGRLAHQILHLACVPKLLLDCCTSWHVCYWKWCNTSCQTARSRSQGRLGFVLDTPYGMPTMILWR